MLDKEPGSQKNSANNALKAQTELLKNLFDSYVKGDGSKLRDIRNLIGKFTDIEILTAFVEFSKVCLNTEEAQKIKKIPNNGFSSPVQVLLLFAERIGFDSVDLLHEIATKSEWLNKPSQLRLWVAIGELAVCSGNYDYTSKAINALNSYHEIETREITFPEAIALIQGWSFAARYARQQNDYMAEKYAATKLERIFKIAGHLLPELSRAYVDISPYVFKTLIGGKVDIAISRAEPTNYEDAHHAFQELRKYTTKECPSPAWAKARVAHGLAEMLNRYAEYQRGASQNGDKIAERTLEEAARELSCAREAYGVSSLPDVDPVLFAEFQNLRVDILQELDQFLCSRSLAKEGIDILNSKKRSPSDYNYWIKRLGAAMNFASSVDD